MKCQIKSRNINKLINFDDFTSFDYLSYDKAVSNIKLFPNLILTPTNEYIINNPNQIQLSLQKLKTLDNFKNNLKIGTFNNSTLNNFFNNNKYTSFSQYSSTKNFFKNQKITFEKTNSTTHTNNNIVNKDINSKNQIIQDFNTNKFIYNTPNNNNKNTISPNIHNIYFGLKLNKEDDEIILNEIFAKTAYFIEKNNFFQHKNKIKNKDKNEKKHLILSDKKVTNKKRKKKIINFELNNDIEFFDPITMEKNDELARFYSKQKLKDKNLMKNLIKNLKKQNINDNFQTLYSKEDNKLFYTMNDFDIENKNKNNNDDANKRTFYDKNITINAYNNLNGYINSYNYNNYIHSKNFNKKNCNYNKQIKKGINHFLIKNQEKNKIISNNNSETKNNNIKINDFYSSDNKSYSSNQKSKKINYSSMENIQFNKLISRNISTSHKKF